ncbi:6-phosphogluconolactonase [Salmonella enterica subsp. enterica]|uniref:6-phosphogluconolactonase n=1 Tax=Salmonella enterica I TaxID=59201 RepID=A0A379WWX6_SALET|nr:6-phosphogluconolactonase [Salmonella enterica subsp. enterica]
MWWEGLDGLPLGKYYADNRTLWVPALKQDRICLFTLSDDGHLGGPGAGGSKYS